jgi:hypothetical protein
MFDLEANGTTFRTELIAGLTTYMTMVYIAFVNPTILAAAGMDKGAVFAATVSPRPSARHSWAFGRAIPWRSRRAWGSTPTSPTLW